jgi:hypothetical protein
MRFILLPLIFLIMTASGYALSLEEYKKVKNDMKTEYYLMGLMNGFTHANATLKLKNAKLLYCQSEMYQITINELHSILKSSMDRFEMFEKEGAAEGKLVYKRLMSETTGVESTLLLGLQEKFPCK